VGCLVECRCAILCLGLFLTGDQPPLVLLCAKQVGAELCWGVLLMREGTSLCLVVGLSFGALKVVFVCMVVSFSGCDGFVFCSSCSGWV